MTDFKITKHYKYVTINSNQFYDSNLSFGAIGLQSWLLSDISNWDGTLADILNKVNTTKEELALYINELKSNGYLEEIDSKSIRVNEVPRKKVKDTKVVTPEEIKTVEEVEVKEDKQQRLNLYQKCQLAIEEYTKDEELRNTLIEYLLIRLNPSKGSRLEDKKISHLNQWKGQLHTLDDMVGDKKEIVQQSINNSWAKFVDIPTSADTATSSTYTKEELDEIKRQVLEIEKKGGKASF